MATINVTLIFQIISICASVLAIVGAIVQLTRVHDFIPICMAIFVMIMSLLLFCVEFYVFSFFKYFGFLIKGWGKGATYILLGCCLWNSYTLNMVISIIFWILGFAYIICSFCFNTIMTPICMRGGVTTLTVSSEEYYKQ